MKLLFDLPSVESKFIKSIIKNDKIMFSTPVDLNYAGKYSKDWLVITIEKIYYLSGDKLINQWNISDGRDFKAVGLVGNGMLEAKINGRYETIVRYTMGHVPRYAYIAKALNQISENKEIRVKSFDEEKTCPICGRVYPEGMKVCPKCTNKMSILKRLWSIAKPHWLLLTVAILLFWIITAIQLVLPYVNRVLIDGYLTVGKKQLVPIILLVLSMGLLNLLNSFITVLRGRVMVQAGNRISRDMRQKIYNKLQELSLSYLNQKKTGDLMNRVTGDTETIRDFIQNQATTLVNQVFSIIGIAVILFSTNWRLALLIIIPAPFVSIICGAVWKRIRLMYHQQWRSWDKANSILQDILSGIRVVKAFGQENKEIKRFKSASRTFADITSRNEKTWNTLFPSLGFLMGLGNFLVMYFGGNLVIGHQMKLGELFQFSQYANMIYGPLNWMSFIPRWFAQAMTSTERIFEVLDEEPQVRDKRDALNHKIYGNVTFKNVAFGYKTHEPVLEDINLDVKKGEMIGLVGHSGSGKTTLINLLMRLYDVDEGKILIDGIDIRDIAQEDLRAQIGVVLQETFLFSGSVLENIAYSKPGATYEEIIRAAKIANAHDFITKFPDGYDTLVGEKGMRLSGGERQRIAIARAILHDPRILILDEATASLDTESEQQIQQALGRLIKNRTTFAIAHRLSTLRNADRLLVLDKGKQAELGTHYELLKKKGIYYNLVMAQRQMSRTNVDDEDLNDDEISGSSSAV